MKPGVVKILANPKACQGCRACEAVCSLQHFGQVNPNATGIKINELNELGKFKQVICQQCIDMQCADVCPEKAITRDSYTGAVIIGESCSGCGACADACPIGAINIAEINGNRKAVKCDLCGGVPQCVAICPRQSLGW